MRFSDADPLYQDRVEGVPVVAVMIPKSKPTHIDGRRPDVDHDVQPFAPTPQSRVPNHERGDLREHLYTAEVWVRCDIGLARRHRPVGEHEAGDAGRGEVVDHVLLPGELALPFGGTP